MIQKIYSPTEKFYKAFEGTSLEHPSSELFVSWNFIVSSKQRVYTLLWSKFVLSEWFLYIPHFPRFSENFCDLQWKLVGIVCTVGGLAP